MKRVRLLLIAIGYTLLTRASCLGGSGTDAVWPEGAPQRTASARLFQNTDVEEDTPRTRFASRMEKREIFSKRVEVAVTPLGFEMRSSRRSRVFGIDDGVEFEEMRYENTIISLPLVFFFLNLILTSILVVIEIYHWHHEQFHFSSYSEH